jgi:CheY-like chemotaxis protein/anti-sigma regulatory factor (Ser/Thr protein kinase)
MESRISGIASLYNQLLKQEDYLEINPKLYLPNLINNIVASYDCDSEQINLLVDINNMKFTMDDAVTTGLLLNELISNSITHGFKSCYGSGKIRIIFNENGIIYSDDGQGFNKDIKTEGIGTTLIDQFSRQLGFSVTLDSSSNGTTYILEKIIETKNTKNNETISKSEYSESKKSQSGEIYIVEDDAIISLERKNFLKKNGYRVIDNFARSSEEAIEYLKHNNPSLILMDIGLGNGKTNGIETLRIIRENKEIINNNIPVIFISGYTKDTYIEELSDLKYEGFLTKPYIAKDLKKTIDSIL